MNKILTFDNIDNNENLKQLLSNDIKKSKIIQTSKNIDLSQIEFNFNLSYLDIT